LGKGAPSGGAGFDVLWDQDPFRNVSYSRERSDLSLPKGGNPVSQQRIGEGRASSFQALQLDFCGQPFRLKAMLSCALDVHSASAQIVIPTS
jgi:hypothetical protein